MSEIQKIHQKLIVSNKTLAFAESCTGGYLSSLFTMIPDASKYFHGSFVTYSNFMKTEVLNVAKETLHTHGAVSREVANEMLLGLMKKSQADYGIAITGIAGPTGGTKEKPVGTVFLAFGEKKQKPHVIECHFQGDRKKIIQLTCEKAISEFVSLFL